MYSFCDSCLSGLYTFIRTTGALDDHGSRGGLRFPFHIKSIIGRMPGFRSLRGKLQDRLRCRRSVGRVRRKRFLARRGIDALRQKLWGLAPAQDPAIFQNIKQALIPRCPAIRGGTAIINGDKNVSREQGIKKHTFQGVCAAVPFPRRSL